MKVGKIVDWEKMSDWSKMKLSKMKVGTKLGNMLHWAKRKWVKLLIEQKCFVGKK